MSMIKQVNFKALLKEFANKSEFEGIVLDYQKKTGQDMHELLGGVLDEFSDVFENPYTLMEMVFRIALKNATDTKTLEKHAREKHELLKQQGKGDQKKFTDIISLIHRARTARRQLPQAKTDDAKDGKTPNTHTPKRQGRIKILFLAANPEQLRLDKELSVIKAELRKAEFRELFDLQTEGAVQVENLQEFILQHTPHIVHFSGHGSTRGELMLEDQTGAKQPVSATALGNLFRILGNSGVRCVVLNACYSRAQAKEVSQHVDCVVGMNGSIGDEAAIAFARAFYRGLGYGKSIKMAFDLGRSQIQIQGLREEQMPKLLSKSGIDADDLQLILPIVTKNRPRRRNKSA